MRACTAPQASTHFMTKRMSQASTHAAVVAGVRNDPLALIAFHAEHHTAQIGRACQATAATSGCHMSSVQIVTCALQRLPNPWQNIFG